MQQTNDSNKAPKAFYHTFGCKLNFAETSTVASMLAEKGIHRVNPGETPDIVIVNTCSVTELADKKCRQTIRAFARKWSNAAIVVTGCYAQLKPQEVASLPGVEIVAGIDRKLKLAAYVDEWLASRTPMMEITPAKEIREFNPSCSRGDRTRWFLKVQDGCDYYCSYCTIPMARGRSRSASVHAVVDKARQAADSGAKEIVITGVNIGDFGKGSSENFFDLIKALEQVNGIERYRISSIEPNLLTDEIIEWVSKSRNFMPHFHIPLQCGDDEVLKLMRRHYDTTLFRHRVETINRLIPDAFIGVDLIVGARGETPERFESSREFVESLDISRLHVFPYSERPGTKALEITPVVENSVRHDRVKTMLAISDDKLSRFTSRFIGTVRPVLLEHSQKDGFMHGFTDNYIKVKVPAVPKLANRIVEVRLDSVDGEEVNATIIG
ncbi:tRNA (N(6)-L-threonylcarbamoyladenosine(37)-C(2))-methylthiotransferase MtaB [Muribaculaceae bacterium Isolate-104 (HZI)]|jgi:threonylcarbamoyladenosine tRNA methylthiotransferase MtaB|nr:tRNA (N(6)-L-threonylcarbamoyladenosine(37)-C(2))-methylthiotransferase MtaB [Muribaculaceae bacterium Isolate-104 (HZI)]